VNTRLFTILDFSFIMQQQLGWFKYNWWNS